MPFNLSQLLHQREFHANEMKIKTQQKQIEMKSKTKQLLFDLILMDDTPTRKKNSITCFIFMGKIESRMYKSDENRAKIRPIGIVSKNCCDPAKIPVSKL